MWVVFEGLDKTGKTTLEWAFQKKVQFKDLVIDRGPAGYEVLDIMLNRADSKRTESYKEQAKIVNENKCFFVVYCEASEESVLNRLNSCNEKLPTKSISYKECQELYRKKLEEYYNKDKIVYLNTSDLSIEECVNKIVEYTKKYEN